MYWLRWFNLILGGAIGVAVVIGVPLIFQRVPLSPAEEAFRQEKDTLPSTSSMLLDPSQYENIGEPVLDLEFEPVSIQLPDLKNQLVLYGRNTRPDMEFSEPPFQFGLRGSDEVLLLLPNETAFLTFSRTQGKGEYRFAEEGTATDLWLQVEAVGQPSDAVKVKIGMRDLQGNLITEPKDRSEFVLHKVGTGFQARAAKSMQGFSLGPNLLNQMKAKWLGKDRFLELHGGTAFEHTRGKERIEFGQGEEAYSVFLAEGEILVWKDGRWVSADDFSGDTKSYPILQMQGVDPASNRLKVQWWQPKGLGSFSMSLPNQARTFLYTVQYDNLHFLGAKTTKVAIVELAGKRMELAEHDWIIFLRDKWEKIDSLKEIDDYVNGRIRGELLVVEGIRRDKGRQVLKTHIFNAARTEVKEKIYSLHSEQQKPSLPFEPQKKEEVTEKKVKIGT